MSKTYQNIIRLHLYTDNDLLICTTNQFYIHTKQDPSMWWIFCVKVFKNGAFIDESLYDD